MRATFIAFALLAALLLTANAADPTTVQPAQPTTAKPAEPTTAKPAEPTTAQPAEPTTAKPAEPTTAKPAEPTTAKPAEPTTAKPAEPTTAKPAEPTTAKPAEPTTAKPAGPTTARPSTAVPATPVPTLPANVTIAFFVLANVTVDGLITTIRNTVPQARSVIILPVDEVEEPRASRHVMQVLAALSENTTTIRLLFVEAPAVANLVVQAANEHKLSGVIGAYVEISLTDDDKKKLVIGLAVGGGVLLLLIVVFGVFKNRGSAGDGEYVAMNSKTGSV